MKLAGIVLLYLLSLSSSVASTPNPVYQGIFSAVDQKNLQLVLQESTGSLPVMINGTSTLITDRYSPEAKANYRAFFMQYFQSLGIPVQEITYPTQHNIGETQGHDVEAVLPGKSKDSIVIIVHYDSIGPMGQETGNPGVDDDMTGMAILMETARVLSLHRNSLNTTVRFVAADYEEQAGPGLEGARKYASYIHTLANQQGFKIVAAVDDEQTGWNCAADGQCGDGSTGDTFDVFSESCSKPHGANATYSYPAMGDALADVAQTYSSMKVQRGCMDDNSDHFAMWEIGVPAVVFSEHGPFNNPHFDQNGGDTYDKIDQAYFFKIAQVGVTFAATLVGVNP